MTQSRHREEAGLRGRDPWAWLWRAAGFSAWGGAVPGLLVLAVLVTVDASTARANALPLAFVVSPLVTALSGGRNATLLNGALATAAAALSGAWNDDLGEPAYWAVLAAVAAGSGLAVAAAASLAGRLQRVLTDQQRSARLGRSERERIEIGEVLQQSLKPPPLPRIPGWSTATFYLPAGEENQVGGDFYDAFRVDGGWMLVVGDVTGRGAEAAAITAQARYTLRTAAGLGADPVAALASLNRALLARRDTALCTAVVVGLGEDGTQPVRLAVAGHPPPLLVEAGKVSETARSGPVLGAFEDATWAVEAVPLTPGRQLVVVTDGVIEARGPGGRFGEERLHAELAAGASPSAVVRRLENALRGFVRGEPDDDAAIVAIAPE